MYFMCTAVIFKSPAGRRNYGKMKRFRPWKQKLCSGERAELREYYYTRVFGCTDADILLRGATVRNSFSLSLSHGFIYRNASGRPSVCPLVASFFPVQFAGEDVETSRAFSTEPIRSYMSTCFFSSKMRSLARLKICLAIGICQINLAVLY